MNPGRFFPIFLTCFMPFSFGGETIQGSFSTQKSKVKGGFTIRVEQDQRVLILHEDFKTKSGPDLQVVLSTLKATDVKGSNAMAAGAVSLGLLKKTKGEQRYVLPPEVDLSRFQSLLVHCVQYSKLWGAAPLSAATKGP